MNYFDELRFYRFVLESNIFQFSEVNLTSGQNSSFKLEWEPILTDKAGLDYIVDCVIGKVRDMDLKPQMFVGVPEGVTGLGFLTQYRWAAMFLESTNQQIVISRKYPVAGSGYVGKPEKMLMVEDTVTTGGSVLRELDKAAKEGVEVVGVVTLTDRMQLRDDGKTAKQVIEERGVAYCWLSDAPRLLIGAYGMGLFNEDLAEKIEAEYPNLKKGWLVGEKR